MRNLFITISTLIAFGSLYPFNFSLPQVPGTAIADFFNLQVFSSSRGDILGNIMLFVPFGFLGVFSLLRHPAQQAPIGTVVPLGILLALSVQILQLFLPDRDAALFDVFWNALGISIGIAAASIQQVKQKIMGVGGQNLFISVPLCLSLAWILSHLAPLVPTLDLQSVKNSMKPMIFEPQIHFSEVLLQMIAWLIALHFCASSAQFSRYRQWVPAVPLLTLMAQPFIIQSELTLDKIFAVLGALVVWFSVARALNSRLLASFLLMALAIKSFAAVDFSYQWNEFLWIPFAGFLEGSMLLNTMSLFEKLFLYGALIWLLREAGSGWITSTVVTFTSLLCLELVQIYVPGRTAELTDPLLATMVALAMYQVSTLPGPKPIIPDSNNTKPDKKSVSVKSNTSHLSSLDGLRGFAALAVFFVHFNQTVKLEGQFGVFDLERYLANGNTGVALFFVLSGFLLSLPFWKHHRSQAEAPFDHKGYVVSRLTRILPAFYLCLLIILCAKLLAGKLPGVNNILSHSLFLLNLKDGNIFSLNPPFWTLAVEMQFYLLLPLLFVGLRRLSLAAALSVVVGLVVMTYLINFGLMSWLLSRDVWPINIDLIWPFALSIAGPTSPVLKYSTMAHLTYFLIGVATAWLFLQQSVAENRLTVDKGRKADFLFWSAALCVLIILSTPLDDVLQLPHARYNWPVVPVLLAVIIYNAPTAPMARKFLDSTNEYAWCHLIWCLYLSLSNPESGGKISRYCWL